MDYESFEPSYLGSGFNGYTVLSCNRLSGYWHSWRNSVFINVNYFIAYLCNRNCIKQTDWVQNTLQVQGSL